MNKNIYCTLDTETVGGATNPTGTYNFGATIHDKDGNILATVSLLAMEHFDEMKNEAYNLGLDEANYTKMELCQEIKKQIPELNIFEAKIGSDPDKRDYIVSNAKLKKVGYAATRTVADGIAELLKAYQIVHTAEYFNV